MYSVCPQRACSTRQNPWRRIQTSKNIATHRTRAQHLRCVWQARLESPIFVQNGFFKPRSFAQSDSGLKDSSFAFSASCVKRHDHDGAPIHQHLDPAWMTPLMPTTLTVVAFVEPRLMPKERNIDSTQLSNPPYAENVSSIDQLRVTVTTNSTREPGPRHPLFSFWSLNR